MTTTTTNPGHHDPTHPTPPPPGNPSGRLIVTDLDLIGIASSHPGSVPARVEMRWPVLDDLVGTRTLIDEGRVRLRAHGDLHGFTVVAEHFDFEAGRPQMLTCVAQVLWFPVGVRVPRVVLDDARLGVAA